MNELRETRFQNIMLEYLQDCKMRSEDYESLTPLQKDVVQLFKRLMKRYDTGEDSEVGGAST